jgi:hypothetical protein
VPGTVVHDDLGAFAVTCCSATRRPSRRPAPAADSKAEVSMQRLGWVLRSTLFFLWMAVTVIPWGTFVVLVSIVLRGNALYWICAAGCAWPCGARA